MDSTSSYTDTLREASSSASYSDCHDPANYTGKSLSDHDKHELLTHCWKVPDTYKFPVTSGRRFNPTWLVNRPWLHYRVKNDSVFCVSCVCFGSSGSPFVSPGFKNWKKALDGKNGYIDRHTHSEAHEEKAALFLHTRQPGMNIIAKISKHVAKHRIGDNLKINQRQFTNFLFCVCISMKLDLCISMKLDFNLHLAVIVACMQNR